VVICQSKCPVNHAYLQEPGKNQLRVKNLKIKVMASQSIIGEKSLAFAKRIARCYVYLKKKGETVMSKQLLRSGTSVGANVREGHYAQSKKDFISKMNIALKEAGETDYWLDVIHSAGYFSDEEYTSLDSDNKELLRMLASIVKNSKKED
jgi:four helix bundle protein